MPELPEVQTIVNDLRSLIRGWTVADFSSLWEKNVHGGDIVGFKKATIGGGIKNISRRAKYILIELDNGMGILVHLRMTGSLIAQIQRSNLKNQNHKHGETKKHLRHWWLLEKGEKKMFLLFSDIRKFGTVDLIDLGEIEKHKSLCKLGREPLADNFTAEALEEILQKKKDQIIRNVLLDQRCVCGIGNIYVSEILFDAKIDPKRKAGAILNAEVAKLNKSIKKILARAIEFRGTTFSDYRDSRGDKGGFQNELKVYNRECERCPRKGCRGVVKKQKIAQRSAFWCPVCQK